MDFPLEVNESGTSGRHLHDLLTASKDRDLLNVRALLFLHCSYILLANLFRTLEYLELFHTTRVLPPSPPRIYVRHVIIAGCYVNSRCS